MAQDQKIEQKFEFKFVTDKKVESKLLILYDSQLELDELACLYAITTDVIVINDFLISRDLVDIIGQSTVILLNTNLYKKYYNLNVSSILELNNLTIVYANRKHIDILNLEQKKKELKVNFIMKYLPTGKKTLVEYLKSLADHISTDLAVSENPCWFNFKRFLSCIC
jgi:hypothetical protein